MKVLLIDPRIKLSVFLVVCVFVMSVTQPLPNLFMGSFILLLLLVSGERKMALIMYMLFVVSLFAAQLVGETLNGILKALLLLVCLLVRLMIPIGMAFNLVFKTTTISQFMAAFQKMHISAVIAIPFAVMFRFIPTLQEEWNGIRQAMAFRGIKMSVVQVVLHPSASVEYVLVPLVFSATSIMDELAAASLARGLDGEHPRTCAVEIKMKWYDWLFLAIIVVFCAVWLNSLWGGGGQ